MIRATNDNPALLMKSSYGASRKALYLPAAVVVAGYLGLLAYLGLAGQTGGALFRLTVVILAVGMPLMLAHAFLRAHTVKLQPMAHALYIHRGFPRAEAIEVPYGSIRELVVRRGIGGRLSGAGTLIISLYDGREIAVCDLADAPGAKAAVERIIDGTGISAGADSDAESLPSATGT